MWTKSCIFSLEESLFIFSMFYTSVHPESGWISKQGISSPSTASLCVPVRVSLTWCTTTENLSHTKSLRTNEIANLILPLPKRREKIICYLRQHWLLSGYSEPIYKITTACACETGFQTYNFPVVSSVDLPVRYSSSRLVSLPLLPLDYAKKELGWLFLLLRELIASKKASLPSECRTVRESYARGMKGPLEDILHLLLCPRRVCE